MVDKKEYAKSVKKVIWFFEGKKGQVIKTVKRELREAKKEKEEEKTSKLEYQLLSLEKVLGHSRMVGVVEKYENDAHELSRLLKIGKPLKRIEGYDISNIYGNEAVGSMVVFKEGEPDKKEYRKFKMKVEGKPNDFAMMKEMLERRFNRYHQSSKKEIWPVPDLVIVDGGKGQLNIATRALKKYNLDIPHISLAKRDEEIFFPGEKTALKLPKAAPALHLVQRVRDEAHRFAVTFHRKRRSKKIRR
jgi:excinuclease ABC subunit C